MVIYVNYNVIKTIIDLFAYSPHNIYTQETLILSLGWEDPLEKEMATHSSILAGKSHGQRSPTVIYRERYRYISLYISGEQRDKGRKRKNKTERLKILVKSLSCSVSEARKMGWGSGQEEKVRQVLF